MESLRTVEGGGGQQTRTTKPDKSVTTSFRISEFAFNGIQEEPKRRNISANILVNQLFTSYANIGRFLNKIHVIQMVASTAKDIFDSLPDEKLAELRKLRVSRVLKTITLAKREEFSLESLLEDVKSVSEYNSLEYTEVIHNGRRTLQFMHELGSKYSLYIGNFLKTALEAVRTRPNVSINENTIVLDLEFSSSSLFPRPTPSY